MKLPDPLRALLADVHPETREAAYLVIFIVGGFGFGLMALVVIVLFYMKY